jgi:8-oxo-dGTP diphosphatase
MNEMRPLVGFGVIIEKDGKILIGKRRTSHGSNTYSILGGHLEFGETFEEGAKREVREESGLDIENVELVSINNDIAYEKHYVSIGLHAFLEDGTPEEIEDAIGEWQWVNPRQLPEPMFPHSKKVIENWLAKKIYNP